MSYTKDISLKHIAKELGISHVSVSNALNGRPGVSNDLRNKIIAKAHALGYQLSARNREQQALYSHKLLTHHSNTIPEHLTKTHMLSHLRFGVVMDESAFEHMPSFYFEIYKNLAKVASFDDHSLYLNLVSEDINRLNLGYFHGLKLNGFFVIGAVRKEIHQALLAFNLPVVVIDDLVDVDPLLSCIILDNFSGMYAVVKKLISCGYKDMCFVGSIGANNAILDRYLGYVKALEEHKLALSAQQWIEDRIAKSQRPSRVYLPRKLPQVLVCNCDLTAALVIEQLKVQYQIPEDIAVVGFGNFGSELDYLDPLTQEAGVLKIFSYDYSTHNIARMSVQTMNDILLGRLSEHTIYVEGAIINGNTIKARI